ncbi:MAG: hypothetical protein WCX71_02425 [Candidatus Buchananbacteria bacterium]
MPKFKNNQSGFVLITSVLVLVSLLIVGSYLISSATSESKISNAQLTATKDYYLAETGIHDMLWKIQNNTTTREAFVAGTLNLGSNNINRSQVFDDNSASYQVGVVNTAPGEAWVISTSTYLVGERSAQRVVKSYISKPNGSGTSWPFSTFSGGRGSQQNGNFTFTGAGIVLISNGGRLHSNQVFKVQGAEVVVNDGIVSSSNVLKVNAGGKLTLNNSTKSVPTSTVEMLKVDFDSTDPNSWKNRATATYTATQFFLLPNNTTLNGITFVNGDATVLWKNMTINGILVVNGGFSFIGAGQNFTINYNSAYGAGLLAEESVSFVAAGGQVKADGLIYSGSTLSLTSAGTDFTINGAVAGFDSSITSAGGAIVINYTPEYIEDATDPVNNPNSPLIQIDHWEEEY